MAARDFTELIVWKVADQLRQHIFEITNRGPILGDHAFRDQIRSASNSVCHNTAEGFGRYGHAEFARFLSIADGSLNETQSQLHAGLRQGYFTVDEHAVAMRLALRTGKALTRLLAHLRTTEAPTPFLGRAPSTYDAKPPRRRR